MTEEQLEREMRRIEKNADEAKICRDTRIEERNFTLDFLRDRATYLDKEVRAWPGEELPKHFIERHDEVLHLIKKYKELHNIKDDND